MTNFEALLTGYPIYIATKKRQRRKHRKKRINKKWKKRYGFYEMNMMPHGQIVMMDNSGIWMTEKTYQTVWKSYRNGE